jgi:hypothetical protein
MEDGQLKGEKELPVSKEDKEKMIVHRSYLYSNLMAINRRLGVFSHDLTAGRSAL